MSNYLLLRDNKQSGPYSVDELKSKGLKPYDLVWLDGKSAAWRYPSEIEELKSFAPVVEEQPFDRFFKKPSASAVSNLSGASTFSAVSTVSAAVSGTNAGSAAPVAAVIAAASPAPDASVRAEQENVATKESNPATTVPQPLENTQTPAIAATTPNRRIIYVTMPVNKTAPVSRETANSEPARAQQPRQERTVQPMMAGAGPALGSSSGGEELFHQDGLNGTDYVEKSLQYNRPEPNRMLRPLILAASVIAILAAGVFIGLSISGNFHQNGHNQPEAVTDRQQDHLSTLPVYTTAANNAGQPNAGQEALSNSVISDPAKQQGAKPGMDETQRKKMMAAKEKQASSTQKNIGTITPKDNDTGLAFTAPITREAVHRADDAADKEAIRNNILNMVSISSNKYNTGTFGGISDLQVTVSNRSIYPLDLVVVEVQYIQANKKTYKTENLYFRGIGAGSALMEAAPKSSRGIKVQYRILLINSKELGLSYTGA